MVMPQASCSAYKYKVQVQECKRCKLQSWSAYKAILQLQDSQPVAQPKRGIFKRIFGRGKQGGEHESFSNFAQYAPQERTREENGQNIVILNSLTHGQLMELLKVTHFSPDKHLSLPL